MRPIFIDTSGWLALINRSDSLYPMATDVYGELFAKGAHFVTHQGVMLEVGNGLSAVNLRQMAVGLRRKFHLTERYSLVNLDEPLYESAWDLFEERPDKTWGLVDCVSFVVMERFGITDALTADRHFEQAGFIRLL